MSGAVPAPACDSLPIFDHHHGRPEVWPGLRVTGLVRRPTRFTAAELAALPHRSLVDDFRCVAGWTAPDQHWEGVPLSAVLEAAGPLPNARYAAISAADFTVAVSLDDAADHALLATRLNGADLPAAHGGPCRLVTVGQSCYASVKWVDAIRLTDAKPRETAQDIAMARSAAVNSPAP